MFRIAKAEDYILLSPSKVDVSSHEEDKAMPLRDSTGRKTKCSRMYATDHGAYVRVLFEPPRCFGFPIAVPLSDDCIQLLLLDVPRTSDRFQWEEQIRRHQP